MNQQDQDKAIEIMKIHLTDVDDWSPGFRSDVIDAMKDFAKYKEDNQWISVDERLPAITSGFFDCLIVRNDKVIRQARFNCKTQRFQDMFFEDIHDNVVKWQPLPTL